MKLLFSDENLKMILKYYEYLEKEKHLNFMLIYYKIKNMFKFFLS